MKNSCLLACAFVCLSIFGCRQTGVSPTNCRSGKCTYIIETNKQIDFVGDSLEQYIDIASGDKLVFTYKYVKNDKENIADDEYTEYIYFEVDPSAESFDFQDSGLSDAALIMNPICFCIPGLGIPLSGSLSGSKINDNRWQVDLDVVFDWNGDTREGEFSAEFEVK